MQPIPLTLAAGGPELPRLVAQLADPPGRCAVVGSTLFADVPRSPAIVEATIGSLSGCACCQVRLDLVDGITGAAWRSPAPQRIVVALDDHDDAVTAVFTILSDEALAGLVRLDAVVVTADAVRLATRLVSGQPVDSDVGLDRLAIADRILVARSRDVTPRALGAIGHVLRSINRTGPVIAPAIAACPLDCLLDVGAWSGPPVVGPPPDVRSPFLGPEAPATVVCRSDRPLDADRIEGWLDQVLARHATRLLRLQGAIEVAGQPNRRCLCGVRSCMVSHGETGPPTGNRPGSMVVLIGRNLPAASLHADFAAANR